MKKSLFSFTLITAAVVTVVSCAKQKDVVPADQVSDAVRAKVQALGFGTSSLVKHEDGYLVEGDILLTEEMLNSAPRYSLLRVGSEEQYHTTNLVTGLPRTITISISNRLPSSYVAALDEAIARYNAEGLQLSFSRVNSGANISIVRGNGQYLASAGFPTSTGQPHNEIKVNSSYLGSNPGTAYLATILAHEIGHCIGFRHTDYMNRAYSCGGSPTNEGSSTVGAVHISGTPTGPDPNSWMLACIGNGQNRPFNANDKTALNYLY